MGRNDRVVLSLLSVVLIGMLWIGWQVRAMRNGQPIAPAFSGVTLEWTVKRPNHEPVKITQQLEVGETEAEWQAELRTLIQGIETFKE